MNGLREFTKCSSRLGTHCVFLTSHSLSQTYFQERTKSPIAWKPAKLHDVAADGTITYMFWMSARNLGAKYGVPFQKVSFVGYHLQVALILKLLTVYCCLLVRHEFHRRCSSHSWTEEIRPW